MIRFLIGSILIIFLVSCHDEEARKQEWIENTIVEKIEEYKQKKYKDCHNQLLEKIGHDADSIMLIRARFDIPDSLIVPDKKQRPGGPQTKFPDFKKPENPVGKEVKDSVIRIGG